MKRNNIRFLYMIIVGAIIYFILHAIVKESGPKPVLDFLVSILITIFAWEGNLWIQHFMNLKYPWEKSPKERILLQLIGSQIFSATVIFVCMEIYNAYICELPKEIHDTMIMISLIIGVMVSIIIMSYEISIQFFNNWKKSLIEIEKYKSETYQAQLQNLKNQVNPHFLFNNLSVLSTLVYKDQDKAVDFINQLSKVYRYLLDNHNHELISLEDELKFIQSYTYLLKIRFDKNINFELDIEDYCKNKMIPPLALQILIENAIKHNEISSTLPLTISIFTYQNSIYVKNNLNLRRIYEKSSKLGLKNIEDRYVYFTNEKIEIIQNENIFKKNLISMEKFMKVFYHD